MINNLDTNPVQLGHPGVFTCAVAVSGIRLYPGLLVGVGAEIFFVSICYAALLFSVLLANRIVSYD